MKNRLSSDDIQLIIALSISGIVWTTIQVQMILDKVWTW